MNTYHTFVIVVKLGSFSAAAKKLHRSPSSISKKISLLEQKLNVQLFDRTTRTLAVTEAGKLYYQRCLDISRRISDAENELKNLSDEPCGSIKITWPNAISTSSIVDKLSAFTEAFPNIKVDISVTNDHVNLIDQNIDFAFRMDTLTDSSMVAIEILRISPVICASDGFVKKYGIPQDIQALAKTPLLLLNHSTAVQKFWKTLPGFKNLNTEDHHSVNDINALYSMVTKGIGATLIFRHTVEKELENGSLIDLIPDYPLPDLPVYLVFNKLNYMPNKMRVFLDFFKQEA